MSINLNKAYEGRIGTFRHQVIAGGIDISDMVISGRTSKSIANACGSFSLMLRPLLKENRMVALPIGMHEYCEIRLDRNRNESGGIMSSSRPTIVMRGLVETVEVQESVSQGFSGSPTRMHTITGADLTKIIERKQLFIPPDLTEKAIAIYGQIFALFDKVNSVEKTDTDVILPLSEWADVFITSVYKDEYIKIANLSGIQNYSIKSNINLPMQSGRQKFRVLSTPIINSFTGSYWDLIEYYCKKPFIEMFMQDNESESVINVRWTPYKNGYGNYPLQSRSGNDPWISKAPDECHISLSNIIDRQVRLSETDRNTYFYCQLSGVVMGSEEAVTAIPDDVPQGTPGVITNPYYDEGGIARFGFRPFIAEIPWIGYLQSSATEDREGAEIQEILPDVNAWAVETLSFTDALYSGYLTIPGNPLVKIGQYLTIEETGEQYYIESVEHTWQVHPSPSYLTKIGVTRGVIPEKWKMKQSEFKDRSIWGNYNPDLGFLTTKTTSGIETLNKIKSETENL